MLFFKNSRGLFGFNGNCRNDLASRLCMYVYKHIYIYIYFYNFLYIYIYRQRSGSAPLPLPIPKNLTFSPLKIGQLCPPQKRNESFSQLGVGCENHPTPDDCSRGSANRPFPRRCELSPYFCPAPLATNAKLVELDTEFRRDDVRETW